MANKYKDLELQILSCFLLEPKLMDETILEDKHFVNSLKIWKFMKAFYKKFGNFDLVLMCSVASNKYKIMTYVTTLIELEPTPANFKMYEKQLLSLFNEQKKERYIINQIYDLSLELWLKSISTSEFKEKIEEIYKNADEIYK